MDFKTHLQTSNLMLLTAITVCAMLGLLTLLPGGLRHHSRHSHGADSAVSSPASRSEYPIVLNLPGPGTLPESQKPSQGTSNDTASRRATHAAKSAADFGDTATPDSSQSSSRPRVVVRTHVLTSAAESANNGSTMVTPRVATAERQHPPDDMTAELTNAGSEIPSIYVPVTVHPVTVNVDNKGLATELAQIHQSLEELRTARLQSAAILHPVTQEPSPAESEQWSEIQQRLDSLDQSVADLRGRPATADPYALPDSSDSTSIIIAPFQSGRRQIATHEDLRPVPVPATPAEQAPSQYWNSLPLNPEQGFPADGMPSAPVTPALPAMPEVPGAPAEAPDAASSIPGALRLEDPNFSDAFPPLNSHESDSSNQSDGNSRTEDELTAVPLNAKPSTTVFQHTYRFSTPVAPAETGVRQASMTQFSSRPDQFHELPGQAQPQTPVPSIPHQGSMATSRRVIPTGQSAPSGRNGIARAAGSSGASTSSGRAARGADGKLRPAEKSGPTTFQKGLAYLRDLRWMPGSGSDEFPDDDLQTMSPATAAVESRTIHRATSALRFANRPPALP